MNEMWLFNRSICLSNGTGRALRCKKAFIECWGGRCVSDDRKHTSAPGTGRKSDRLSRQTFKWPHDTYMPSSSTYHLFPAITNVDDAKAVVGNLDDSARSLLLQELQQFKHDKETTTVSPVTTAQLYQVFTYNTLPFIGFGILDNGIMIVAGEYIDVTIGAALGISTMAGYTSFYVTNWSVDNVTTGGLAAALGNLISDVAGVGTAGYIELMVSKLGVEPPDITVAQSQLKSVRWMVAIGRAIGVTIGCLLGMLPLVFYNNEQSTESESQTTASDKAS